jgi:hypothetical protein
VPDDLPGELGPNAGERFQGGGAGLVNIDEAGGEALGTTALVGGGRTRGIAFTWDMDMDPIKKGGRHVEGLRIGFRA